MPRPLVISGTLERACPESQGLDNDDNDDNEEPSYPCHSAPPTSQCKGHDNSGDSQMEDPGEPIPFLLRGFLKPRHSCTVKEEGLKNRMYAKRLARHALELEEDGQEFQEPIYKDTGMSGSLSEDEDNSWTRSYHLPVHERSHGSRVTNMAPSSSYDSFQHNPGKHLEVEAFAPWVHASDPYLAYPEHNRGAEPHALHEESIGDREFSSLQLTYEELREENCMLRWKIRSMQSFSESQARTVRSLERRLKASMVKEERETQGLESLVQQTERSLQLMTQRALEAENNVEKLKRELYLLQGELESFKVENENLRAGQTTDLGAMKQNIDIALQNLHRIVTGANWSIRQLVSGTELLHFVAELLKSTGKISEVEAEDGL
ncbi:endosome-associated-trafficking regulator 1-like [Rhea pennata]|uniref:endosome-associated-trafficking regulator 1-like n=1 Tax=Rhea pennata TaxID=8795 RepID=UPI002E26E091